METDKLNFKRVFVSYCWTSKEHIKWVLELATDIIGNGIDVIIDKWDLPEGEDKFKFMERMVNDKSIDKVLILSDKKYAQKADQRVGGVGTETQIISSKLYESFSEGEQNNRFVAIVCQNDENGKPYLPTYYKNRIYIDFSDNELRNENFEQLIRWIFEKPLFKKPEIGKPPSFIVDQDKLSLGTNVKFKNVINAFKYNQNNARGALIEYLETYNSNLEKFKLVYDQSEKFYEKVADNVKLFSTFRDEFIDVEFNALNYLDDQYLLEIYHHFFEEMIKNKLQPKNRMNWNSTEVDNYVFIIYELFLYFCSVLLKKNKFLLFNEMLKNNIFISNTEDFEDGLYPYTVFNTHIQSFSIASQKLQRISYYADQIINNANSKKLNLLDIMQTDFILFIRSDILLENNYIKWNPKTGVYIASREPKFELFLRSESKTFFEKFKICLGVANVEELKKVAKEYHDKSRKYPEYYSDSLYPPYYMNLVRLCSS